MFYCPKCQPELDNTGRSVAWCETHSPARGTCPDCQALAGDQHYVGCPQKDPQTETPSGNISKWIRRHMIENSRKPAG